MGSADTDRMYMCIDLKSFYASVECADLGLDPLQRLWWWLMGLVAKGLLHWPFHRP